MKTGRSRNFRENQAGGNDTRRPAALPHGTGKSVRVAVFAKGEKAQEAEAAGADIVGEKELVEQVRQTKANTTNRRKRTKLCL